MLNDSSDVKILAKHTGGGREASSVKKTHFISSAIINKAFCYSLKDGKCCRNFPASLLIMTVTRHLPSRYTSD